MLALGPAPSAGAATVSMGGTNGTAGDQFVAFTAAPGERNRVTVVRRVGHVTITDTGVRRLQSRRQPFGAQCRNLSAHTVTCRQAGRSFPVSVDLGNGNDRVAFDFRATGGDAIPSDPAELGTTAYDEEFEGDFEGEDGAIEYPAHIRAGTGDDVIVGSALGDAIYPGAGRDRVMAGGGRDFVGVEPDGARDVLQGGAGLNHLSYASFSGKDKPVTVDTRTGRAGAAGEGDRIRDFRRVTGGSRDDTLLGSDRGEALYGARGNDLVDGRGGADLIVGDSPLFFESANRLLGGKGDDLIDARSDTRPSDLGDDATKKPPLATSTVTCGDGSDRVASDTDDLLDPSCEAAVYRVWSFETERETVGVLFAPVMSIAPVSRGADGAPTFDVPCPAKLGNVTIDRCIGAVALERPPTAGSTTPPEQLGSGSFDLAGGKRAPVTITLNDAGRQALATPGTILAVHVTAVVSEPPPAGAGCPPGIMFCRNDRHEAEFGWQEAF